MQVIYPFLLLSKKRYVGGYYEDESLSCKIKHMGVVLKRRDNAPIVKHFYAGVVDILLRHIDSPEFIAYRQENPNVDVRSYMIHLAQQFVRKEAQKLLQGEFEMERFIVTKSLSAEYKDPDRIAQRVLADRANERGTDNFQSNDRVAYIVVQTQDKKALQGERIETPSFVIENDLKIDYGHYISKAIEKPVSQIFALLLEKLDGYMPVKHDTIWKKHVSDAKKCEEKRMEVVADLLFGPLLREYDRKMSGNRAITDFFKKR